VKFLSLFERDCFSSVIITHNTVLMKILVLICIYATLISIKRII